MDLATAMRRALDTEPSDRAILFEGVWLDWGWMRRVADAVDQALSETKIADGASVGLIARNRPVDAAALLALMRQARPIVMIYPFQSEEGIAGDIADLGLAAVIAEEPDWSDAARAAAADAGTAAISLVNDAAPHVLAVAGLETVGAGPHREASIPHGVEMLTSGTTGKPKHLNMSFDLIFRSMIGETITRGGVDKPASAKMPAFQPFPFGNISGLYNYMPAAAAAQPVMLLDKFRIEPWRDLVRTYRPTSVSLPPAGVQMVLDADIPPEDLSSLDFIFSGAAHLDEGLHREFERRYGCIILLAYGATEFGGPVTLMTVDQRQEFGDAKFGSVGRAWAGAGLRVVDPDTFAPLPPGTQGLLEVIAPRIGPDWIRTTDLAVIDEDGFVYHKGRADGAISRGGFKILPETVAEAMRRHPSVAEACVVGLKDERLGEVPVAAVELMANAPRPTEDDLKAHARNLLFRTHVPVSIMIVDRLPRTPSLKVSIPAVRRMFDQG